MASYGRRSPARPSGERLGSRPAHSASEGILQDGDDEARVDNDVLADGEERDAAVRDPQLLPWHSTAWCRVVGRDGRSDV
ncbi:unnamed protein product [Diplocarpon coronariae]